MRTRWESLNAANVELAESYARLVCAARRKGRLEGGPPASSPAVARPSAADTDAAGGAATGLAAEGAGGVVVAGPGGAVAESARSDAGPPREHELLEAGLVWDTSGQFYHVQVILLLLLLLLLLRCV